MKITIINDASYTLRVYASAGDAFQDSGASFFSISGNRSTTIYAYTNQSWANPEQAW